jgi:HEAT repeat protein
MPSPLVLNAATRCPPALPARLRDARCRDRLLAWLDDPSARVAFIGADGLRDLRDPTTATALLRAASHEDPDVAVTATHALVSMASPTVLAALDALAGHVDERARALAGRWAAQWARREDLGA